MIGPVLQFDDLRQLARLPPRATLARVTRWADKIGLKYQYDAAGGIWTTTDALNVALGVTSAANEDVCNPDKFG